MVSHTILVTHASRTGAIQASAWLPEAVDFIHPVRSMVRPVSEAQFGGVLDLKKIPSLGDRIKFVISVLLGVCEKGDHRDWNAITSWSSGLNTKLN